MRIGEAHCIVQGREDAGYLSLLSLSHYLDVTLFESKTVYRVVLLTAFSISTH